jgi:hypothetical protein
MGHERVLLVESSGSTFDRVNLDGPDANLPGQVLGSAECVDQQELTHALTLGGLVNRQSPDQNHRHIDAR